MDYGSSFYLTGAEIGLALTALVLLLVTAWGGQKAARLVTIIAVAALTGAAIFTAALMDDPGTLARSDAFFGLFRLDAFAGFRQAADLPVDHCLPHRDSSLL